MNEGQLSHWHHATHAIRAHFVLRLLRVCGRLVRTSRRLSFAWRSGSSFVRRGYHGGRTAVLSIEPFVHLDGPSRSRRTP